MSIILTEKQGEIVNMNDNRILAMVGRQGGKTTMGIARAVRICMERNEDVTIVVSTGVNIRHVLGMLAELVPKINHSERYAEMPNGKKIFVKTMPFKGNVVFDDAFDMIKDWIILNTPIGWKYRRIPSSGNPVFAEKMQIIFDDPAGKWIKND